MDDFLLPWIFPYPPAARWLIEPSGLYAGATLKFCKQFPYLSAQNWTLNYGLVLKSGQVAGPVLFSSAPLSEGSSIFLVNVLPAITAPWTPGLYEWQSFAKVTTLGAETLGIDPTTNQFVSTGQITVFPNLTTVGSYDSRGPFQRILDEIDALILSTAGDPMMEISIGRGTIAGMSTKGWTKKDLIEYRDYYANLAANETRIRNRRGGAPNPRVKYANMGGYGVANGFPDQVPFA